MKKPPNRRERMENSGIKPAALWASGDNMEIVLAGDSANAVVKKMMSTNWKIAPAVGRKPIIQYVIDYKIRLKNKDLGIRTSISLK